MSTAVSVAIIESGLNCADTQLLSSSYQKSMNDGKSLPLTKLIFQLSYAFQHFKNPLPQNFGLHSYHVIPLRGCYILYLAVTKLLPRVTIRRP